MQKGGLRLKLRESLALCQTRLQQFWTWFWQRAGVLMQYSRSSMEIIGSPLHNLNQEIPDIVES
jgi:hypothetical protein